MAKNRLVIRKIVFKNDPKTLIIYLIFFKILDVRRISSQIGAMGTWQGAISPMKNAGGYHDVHNTVHSVSPQLLNEMIDYADENDIKRSRDMVIRKEFRIFNVFHFQNLHSYL